MKVESLNLLCYTADRSSENYKNLDMTRQQVARMDSIDSSSNSKKSRANSVKSIDSKQSLKKTPATNSNSNTSGRNGTGGITGKLGKKSKTEQSLKRKVRIFFGCRFYPLLWTLKKKSGFSNLPENLGIKISKEREKSYENFGRRCGRISDLLGSIFHYQHSKRGMHYREAGMVSGNNQNF